MSFLGDCRVILFMLSFQTYFCHCPLLCTIVHYLSLFLCHKLTRKITLHLCDTFAIKCNCSCKNRTSAKKRNVLIHVQILYIFEMKNIMIGILKCWFHWRLRLNWCVCVCCLCVRVRVRLQCSLYLGSFCQCNNVTILFLC